MTGDRGTEGSLHISGEKLFALIRSLTGGGGFEDPDHPLPHGPWDPLIRVALIAALRSRPALASRVRGPHPEPWRSHAHRPHSEAAHENRANLVSEILRVIAERHPEIWDVIGGGRRDAGAWVELNPQPEPPGIVSFGSLVELNPQPLPPRVAFSVALAEAVVERGQLMHDVAGEERGIIIVGGYLSRFADEYCGNGFRIKWPFPGPPPPWISEEVSGVDLLVAAARFDLAARQSFDRDLGRAFSDAGAKLAAAGLSRLS